MAWQNTHKLGLGLPYPYSHFVSGLSTGKSIPVHTRPSTQERCMRGTGEAVWLKMRCDDGPAISGSRHVWAGVGQRTCSRAGRDCARDYRSAQAVD